MSVSARKDKFHFHFVFVLDDCIRDLRNSIIKEVSYSILWELLNGGMDSKVVEGHPIQEEIRAWA